MEKGPTMLLGATCAPLNDYFIFSVFLDFFWYIFKTTLKY